MADYPWIPKAVFQRITEVERRIGKKITMTVNSNLTGHVTYEGRDLSPITFKDLNTLYASIEVVNDLH